MANLAFDRASVHHLGAELGQNVSHPGDRQSGVAATPANREGARRRPLKKNRYLAVRS
jgi:hypothetical protein